MKVTREIADFNRLREVLRSAGYDGRTWQIVTGTIIQIGKKVEGSEELLGLILLDESYDNHRQAGFRPSHQYHFKSTSKKKPGVGDRVFLVPCRPPEARRPYALKWGLLKDLENPQNGFTKTQNIIQYVWATLCQAYRIWVKNEP